MYKIVLFQNKSVGKLSESARPEFSRTSFRGKRGKLTKVLHKFPGPPAAPPPYRTVFVTPSRCLAHTATQRLTARGRGPYQLFVVANFSPSV